MKPEEYITTLVINNHMINIGMDDYGQTYFLEYIDKNGNITQESIGTYETDYLGYAEMLFEDPKNCSHYCEQDTCDILEKTYCGRCVKSELYQDRDKRFMEQFGMTYNEYIDNKYNK